MMTTDSNEVRLEPCPWCPTERRETYNTEGGIVGVIIHDANCFLAACERRQILTPKGVTAWNSRASVAAPKVAVACGICKFHWDMIVMPGDKHNPNCPYFNAAPAPVAPSLIPEQERWYDAEIEPEWESDRDHPGDTISCEMDIEGAEGQRERAHYHFATKEWCRRAEEWPVTRWRRIPAATPTVAVEQDCSRLDNWPIPDVLNHLAEATEHLLRDHDCDEHGWETWKYAAEAARKHIQQLTAPSSLPSDVARKAAAPQGDAHAPLRAAVEIAEAYRAAQDGWRNVPTRHEVQAIIAKHAPAAPASPSHAEPACAWTLDDSNDGEVWETGCGETFQFTDGGPEDNKFVFCYKCGKRIDVGRYSDFTSVGEESKQDLSADAFLKRETPHFEE